MATASDVPALSTRGALERDELPTPPAGRLSVALEQRPRAQRTFLHVERGARERYDFNAEAFTVGGRLLAVDFGEAQRITAAMNAARESGAVAGPLVAPGELGAAALLHELAHAVLDLFEWRGAAVASVSAALGAEANDRLLAAMRERFPPPSRVVKATSGADSDSEVDTAGEPTAETTFEELLLLGEARDNRALEQFSELFTLGTLTGDEAFERALAGLRETLSGVRVSDMGAAVAPQRAGREDRQRRANLVEAAGDGEAQHAVTDLLTLLRSPARRHPGSLKGQLSAAIELWAPLLGARFALLLERALRGVDQLSEEHTFVTTGFHGPPPPAAGEYATAGDEAGEAAYSRDSGWMTGVVMVAKNAFVWLEQLSQRHGRRIERLDQVPDEELAVLAEQGFDTIWLVGVWHRSDASKTIKRLRGQPFAEASAYAIYDYAIAPELGGEEALAALSARAAAHGLRLAGDMVPNHTGIDARWVEEQQDWYLSLQAPPFASYRFSGPDLTPGRPIELRLEDGYYDGSDAAVVFERRDRASGEVSYLYHGNDGTAMPWNDTAQLDYLNPAARAAVIETIVAVAQRFKVIRFDAAMTLVKRHIRRLWHPPPGEGGAVPSRSRHAIFGDDFERAMPHEFWREVVDTLAVRAPDTLLVAEAFWLLEGYFVRTLGMHRVYNSAFMHLLAAERNAEHRRLLRRTLASHPGDLERFVNYLTTPDEESAAETFGRGDKYFAAALMLVTFPGTPLFGHGQVDGLGEKYGMEFRAPRLAEVADDELNERHLRVLAPLLARRAEFASASGFYLADVVSDDGGVLEDVYAYLFARTPQRQRATLVLVNNSSGVRKGRLLRVSAADDPDQGLDLTSAFGFGDAAEADDLRATFHDSVGGSRTADGKVATRIWNTQRLRSEGLAVELGPYRAVVYLDIDRAYQVASDGAAVNGSDDAGVATYPQTGRRGRRGRDVGAVMAAASRFAGAARAAARRRR